MTSVNVQIDCDGIFIIDEKGIRSPKTVQIKDIYWLENTFKIKGGYDIAGSGRLMRWSDSHHFNVVLSNLSITGKCDVIIRIPLAKYFSLTASNQSISLYGDNLKTEMYLKINNNGHVNGYGIINKLLIEGTGNIKGFVVRKELSIRSTGGIVDLYHDHHCGVLDITRLPATVTLTEV